MIVPMLFKTSKNLLFEKFFLKVIAAGNIKKLTNRNAGNARSVIPIGPPSFLIISKDP